METASRHQVKVTASPLVPRVVSWREKRVGSSMNHQEAYQEAHQEAHKETDSNKLSPADVATQLEGTQLMPDDLHLTQRIYEQGQRSVAVVGAHTVRAGRSRSSGRAMRKASRIAYKPATLKGSPPFWVIAVTIAGFSLLFGVLLYFGMIYLKEYFQTINGC